MANEIIVEFPTPLTDKEKKMIYGYKGEIVRCKDCKYYLNSNEKCGLVDTRLRFYETDKVWTKDSFCSWGERRDDD